MRRHHVEQLEPLTLLAGAGTARERFDAVWPLLQVDAENWHRAVRLEQDGGLFLKGAYVGLWSKPQHFLRRWHVHNEFRNLLALRDLGLAKSEPLAWGCESRFGLPVRSFLVQRAISGAEDFAAYVRDRGEPAERTAVFRAVGETVRALHDAGWIHGDLACRNLLVRPAGPEVMLVDLARVKPVRPGRIGWRRRKELYRLVKSADKCGAAPSEVDAMLEAAVGEQAADVIASTRRLRAIERRTPRKLLTWYWRITGRPLS